MSAGLVLAIDLGTSGVKVALVDDCGHVLGSGGEPLATMLLPGGGAEQDPEGWWLAIGRCTAQALAASGRPGREVGVVAVTSQYMSTVAIAADGTPLMNAVMWMDTRGRPHHGHMLTGEAFALWLDRHGLPPLGNDDLAHIAFIRHERPAVHDAAAAFVEPVDYLNARLTGRIAATQTTAFPLLTVDNRRHGALEYATELVEFAGVDPAKLPPLVPFDEVLGPVTPAAADHLGITTAAAVMTGTIDSITSAVGSAAVDASTCSIIVGTTSVIVTHVDDKRADLEHGLTSVPSPLPGKYFVMAENGIGGKALEVFLRGVVYADDGFGTGPVPDDAFERAERVAAAVPSGSEGVLFLPWLVGSMAPGGNHDVRAGFVNLGLGASRAAMCRAVLEGVAFNAAWLLPHVRTLAEGTWDELRMGGGGALSAVWGQAMADALDLPVDRLANPRTTNARGATLLALVQLGRLSLADLPTLLSVAETHDPDPRTVAQYRHLAAALVDFHERSAPFYRALRAVRSDP